MRLPLATLLLMISAYALPVFGANAVYISQSGAGAQDGLGCATAKPVTYFNTVGNWSATPTGIQIGPDTTVHLCGTFTASAGGGMLIIKGNGSSGHPVIILFETNANLTAPYFQFLGGAIDIEGNSYITIDGGTNGIIQDTANGTGFANHAGSVGVWMNGTVSNITVENLTFANFCQHTSNTDATGCSTSGNSDAPIFMDSNPGGVTNVTITQNTIHDATTGIVYAAGASDSGNAITYNTFTRTNWAMNIANGVSSGLTITNNDISCVVANPCNWNDDLNTFHHNGIMIDPQTVGSLFTNMVIANNYIHDINTCTAGIFFDPSNAGNFTGTKVYNNVFFTTPGQVGPADGWLTIGVGAGGVLVANNTVIGPGGIGVNAVLSPTIENNIVENMTYGEVLNSGYSGAASDYNDWFNVPSGMVAGANFYATVAAWVSATGFDTHSITTDPNLGAGFVPPANSPVRGVGLNLTSLGITGLDVGAPQSFGVGGTCGTGCTSRPAGGAWDMGAYPYSSGSQVATPTFSPVAGTYVGTQNVTISTSTGGAALCYTTDGTTPTANGAGTCTHGTTYSTPVVVASSQTLSAIGSHSGQTDSAVGSAGYTISGPTAPTIAIMAGKGH